ncbi:hypothetical protein [Antrihabitans sp. YC2-6]|uniref:hypothetical protein n=1 Tax=Antrihabitans sp. YC2-6 TaxID=2799498 RepID=UPI0018F4639B|nr:hypothetical protein [Antrihabitans sp. YC2-6]MBJ8345012.1 hypothetical protein [Antrihabitans sp. YC2-6]
MNRLTVRTVLAALAVTSSTLLIGCSSDESSTDSATSASSAAPASATQSTDAMMELIPSPFADAPQPAGTYLGSVDGTDAYIALVMSGDNAVAFICDGSSMWAWPNGTFTDNQLSLSDTSGMAVQARMVGGAISGTVKIGGTDHNFTATPAEVGEGVYRTIVDEDGVQSTVGWIIRNEGARGLERSSTGAISNAISTNRIENDDDRRRRERREEEERCDRLAQDLADAQATLAELQARPREGGNIQMVALAQQRLDRLVNSQC